MAGNARKEGTVSPNLSQALLVHTPSPADQTGFCQVLVGSGFVIYLIFNIVSFTSENEHN